MKVALKEFLLFYCAVLNMLCSTVYGMESKETVTKKKAPVSPERLNAQVAWLGEFMAFIDAQKGVRFKKASSRMDALNGPIMTIVLKLEDSEQKQPSLSLSSSSSSSQSVTNIATSTVQEAAPVLQQTIATVRSCMARAIPAEATPSKSVVSEKSAKDASSSMHAATVIAGVKGLKRSSTCSSLASIMQPGAIACQQALTSSTSSTAPREQECISLSQVLAEQASRLTAEFHEDVKESKETSEHRFNGVSSGEDLSEFIEHWSLSSSSSSSQSATSASTTQSVTASSSSSAKAMSVPSVQSMTDASASTKTLQAQSLPYTISASAKKVWETKVATNAPILRVPQVQLIVEEDQIGQYPGEMPLEGSDMSCHWCFS